MEPCPLSDCDCNWDLQQMGSGSILVTGDCNLITGCRHFQLFCLYVLLFIKHKLSSGTCQNAMKARKNHFLAQKENISYFCGGNCKCTLEKSGFIH